VRRRLSYFGFELDAMVEPLDDEAPPELLPLLRQALTRVLLAGETVHPSQARLRRAVSELSELWRRSAGTLSAAAPDAVRERIAAQLESVTSWRSFLGTPVELEPAELVPRAERERLMALPGSVRVFGDAVAIHYELGPDGAAARLQLREGQARRLSEADLPRLDRPIRFAVVRGNRPALEADTLDQLQAALTAAEATDRRGRQRLRPARRRGR
jgi:hypothetical protein